MCSRRWEPRGECALHLHRRPIDPDGNDYTLERMSDYGAGTTKVVLYCVCGLRLVLNNYDEVRSYDRRSFEALFAEFNPPRHPPRRAPRGGYGF